MILRRIVVFHRHVRVPLLVSDDDQTQRVQTPSGLRQRIHHLLTVAFDRRQFVVTDVRVHRLQRFQTRQLRRQLFIGFVTRRVDQPCAALAICASPCCRIA